MRVFTMMAGITALLVLLPAEAAKFSGRVIVSGEFRESLAKDETNGKNATRDYYWKLPNGIIPVLPPKVNPASDLAVVLFKKDAPPPKPDQVSTVKVLSGGLEKKVVVTRPGSTIKFQNESSFNFELFAEGVASFKAELQSTKSVRAIEFPEEGIYEVRCKLMPHFLAYVVVTAGADLEVKGDGTITKDLEQGEYTLKVFHGGKWVYKHSFSVGKGRMDPLEIKLEPGRDVGQETGQQAAEKADGKSDKEAGKKKKKK